MLPASENFRATAPSPSTPERSGTSNPSSSPPTPRFSTNERVDFQKTFLHNARIMEDSMATLNIKNMPNPLYKKLQARAKRERRSVAQEVIQILAQATEEPESLSILALKGLGKEVWRGVDSAAYIEQERRSWD